ncbi:protoporphyrinogen oxidase [Ferroacidibacillus organovorans]|uniref:Coproporphyrinogen III oxidase n=1 Tax=Ferroacidibacillus organovorans TaxID=1765683 RepID=A0A162TCR1_9BACL|nr:protoporphyrinogen oxidase [Ferroacidibacillus organovorans]KYP80673.1 hypothetical protein AYJ22_10255 [Ferroacidibacillus organovorans]OAG93272.1 hypothetical protein AYW79_11410 [Ferroacidibacillus organovorans]OPG15915.1 protoporphyrinogen oxidase [Ferroacidibacillus organovorans]
MSRQRVAVIGAGITGLTAAYRLMKTGRVDVTVFEARDQVGGTLRSVESEQHLFEQGPDSFLARKRVMIDLCTELGLREQLVGTGPLARKTYLVSDGELYPFPKGTYMGIPLTKEAFEQIPFLSEEGKRRALLDLTMGPDQDRENDSMGELLTRRLGREVVEKIAEAVLAGVHASPIDRLSVAATYPEFKEAVRRGSLLRGLQDFVAERQNVVQDDDLPKTAFLTLRSGLSKLAAALLQALHAQGVTVHTGCVVTSVENSMREVIVHAEGCEFSCDAVVMAVPAHRACTLVNDEGVRQTLEAFRYASVATVALAYRPRDFLFQLDGSGFVVPRREGSDVTACTFVSSKWPHMADEDVVTLRAFVGRAEADGIVDAPDEEIIARVRGDLAHWLKADPEPIFSLVTRWKKGMPQYEVGHLTRVAALTEAARRAYPRVIFSGAAYRGVGLPDCVADGMEAAQSILEALSS